MADLPPELRLLESVRRAWRQERARVSGLLHDDIGQTLTAVGLELDLLTLDFAGENPPLAERIAAVQKTLEQAFQTVRSLSHEMHPDPVGRFGLIAAVERMAEEARRRWKAELELQVDRFLRLDGAPAAALYDCGREALDNAIRHSGATVIRIGLRRENDQVAFEITDNGCGFNPATVVPGVGFITIEYYKRLRMVYLRLETNVSHGTSVTLISPNRNH
ncbi:MAG: hypothetical protein IT168_24720 [Bryobacterales bacterium]|nr:hypothetical protein [Bryobacterales bacterium]